MTNQSSLILISVVVVSFLTLSIAVGAEQAPQTPVEKGRAIAVDLCQACHTFPGADQAGTVGPEFIKMKARFPEREKLRAIIYDAHKALKRHTMMPPFGRHGFVDKEQTEQLIDFIYTL